MCMRSFTNGYSAKYTNESVGFRASYLYHWSLNPSYSFSRISLWIERELGERGKEREICYGAECVTMEYVAKCVTMSLCMTSARIVSLLSDNVQECGVFAFRFLRREKDGGKAIERQKRSHSEQSGCVIQAHMGAVELFRIIKTAPREGQKKECQQERTA